MERNKTFTKSESQCMKGIAVMIMVMYHCFHGDFYEGYTVSYAPFPENYVRYVIAAFKICVGIFVFISGYGLTVGLKNASPDYRLDGKEQSKWIVTRLIRLLSGFWFVYLLSFLTCMFIDRRPITVYFKDGMVRGIFNCLADFMGINKLLQTPSINNTWWYMSAAVVFVILLPSLARICKKNGGIFLLSACIIIPRILNIGFTDSQAPLPFLFPFLLGIVFAENDLFSQISDLKFMKNRIANESIKFMGMLLGLGIFVIIYNELNTRVWWEVKYGLFAVYIICFCREFILPVKLFRTVLEFIGRYSMDIFLIHPFIRRVYLKDFTYSFQHFIIIYVVLFGISLVISILVEWLKRVLRYQKLMDLLTQKSIRGIDAL